MRNRAITATGCVGRVATLVALMLGGGCTDMGPEPFTPPVSTVASAPAAGAPASGTPRFRRPVPRPDPAPWVGAAEPPAEPSASVAAASPSLSANDQPEQGAHRVRADETVYDIAKLYGVDAYTLVNANGLAPPFDLVEGQRLTIPRAGQTPGAPPTSATTVVASSAPSTGEAGAEAPEWHPIGRPESAEKPAVSPERSAALPPRPSSLPAPPPTDGGFAWPIEGTVLSDFGPKGGGRYNDGINIATTTGAPVHAAQAGVVAYAGNELRGFGNMLLIKHSGGWVTAYAHNQELLVSRGDRVARGQVIARAGATGGVDQPQLHFEIRKGKTAVDPLQQLRRPSATASSTRSAG